MLTTMAMVYDGLQKLYPCSKQGAYDPSTPVSFATSRVSDNFELHTRAVLVTSQEALDVNPKRVIELCEPGKAPTSSCSLVVYCDRTPGQVVAIIEALLCECRAFYDSIASAALGGASVQELVDMTYELVKNPIIVHDRVLRVQACTTYDAMNDEMWRPLDASSEVFAQPAEAPGFNEFLEQIERNRVIPNFRMFNGKNLAACRTRSVEGDFLFACLIEKNRPITDADLETLEFMTSMIEIALKSSGAYLSETMGLDGLLMDAFEGRISNRFELENRMRVLGVGLSDCSRAIVLVARKGRLNDRQAHRLIDDILSRFPFMHGLHHDDKLLFLETFAEGKGMGSREFEALSAFLAQSNLCAGVGVACSLREPLSESYETALQALSIGRRVNDTEPLHFFDTCRPYYLYESCISEGDVELFIHPALDIVAAYDQHAKTPLTEVLDALTRRRGNRSEAAHDLFIQRNTLQARIRTIEELCSIDLSDWNTCEHIRRSFELRAFAAESATSEGQEARA